MGRIQVARKNDEPTLVQSADINKLNASLMGRILFPGDEGYDDARHIWNGMIDRTPAIIVRCVNADDVGRAVAFARDRDLLVSVRGGGHNVSGNAVCQGGLMIDLSPMRRVEVDVDARTAGVEGGATWGDFDSAAQEFGLATTGGFISTTGVAGLTLGGGIGWLMGSYGLACDNLLSVELVTADGQRVRASQNENPELFWGLKGGGGNFGVATEFEFRVHPVGPSLLAGMLVHPLDQAREALNHFRQFIRTAPNALGALGALVTRPDAGPVLALVPVYNGPLDAGERVVQPLRTVGPPVDDTLAPMRYIDIQTMFDGGAPAGRRYYFKSSVLERLTEDAVDVLVDCYAKCPSSMSKVFVECFGGAMSNVDREQTAFTHRDSPFNLLIIAAWEDPAADEENVGWARETWQAIQPYASEGVYMNYLGQSVDEGAERLQAAYGVDNFSRLARLKAQYDPDNLFHMNQNIPPAWNI